jgi:uncharacterized Zn finger protein
VRARGEKIKRAEIRSIVRDESLVRARVAGTDVVPYRVDIDAASGSSTCTCPYEYGGACKHAVAVALLALREWNAIEERPLKSRTQVDLSKLSEDDAISLLEAPRESFSRVVREFVAQEMREFEYGDPEDEW